MFLKIFLVYFFRFSRRFGFYALIISMLCDVIFLIERMHFFVAASVPMLSYALFL